MAIPFQVEFVDPNGRFVLARQLEEVLFVVDDSALLNGCRITAAANPPAQDPDGNPRIDLYLFALRERADASRFKVGTVVSLEAKVRPPPRILY
ncbi:MAG: hypothetical protein ACK4N5_11785 [Myxococcales bacterium]